MLTVDDAHRYLIDRGLMRPGAVLDGDLDVISATRRNRNLQVTSREDGSYLIKQSADPGSGAAETIRREAWFYTLCADPAAPAALRALLVRPVVVDQARAILVLELLRDATPLWRFYEQRPPERFPEETAAAVGSALAVLHDAFPAPVWEDPRLAPLSQAPPWILQVHRPAPSEREVMSAANLQMVRILQEDPEVGRHLDQVSASWQPASVIHGDVKMDNFLVLAAEDGGEAGTGGVRLVDWEMVQIGDPAWDVAGVLQDFVFFWVLSMPHEDPGADMVRRARFPLAALQPGIGAFWRSYRRGRVLSPQAAEALLDRAVRFAAVRVVQTAYEIAGHFPAMPPPSVLLLQIGVNLLRDPARGRTEVFGIPAGEGER